MRRFDHGELYMEEDDEGKYVLHSDHAAELARVEGERDHYRDDLHATRAELARVVAECNARGAEAAERLEQVIADRNGWAERVHTEASERDAFRDRAKDLEAANTLLRAECEAWRAITLRPGWTGTIPVGHMIATDAAGVLKGSQQ